MVHRCCEASASGAVIADDSRHPAQGRAMAARMSPGALPRFTPVSARWTRGPTCRSRPGRSRPARPGMGCASKFAGDWRVACRHRRIAARPARDRIAGTCRRGTASRSRSAASPSSTWACTGWTGPRGPPGWPGCSPQPGPGPRRQATRRSWGSFNGTVSPSHPAPRSRHSCAATANPHSTIAVVIDLAAAQPVSLFPTRRRSAGRTGRRSARPGRWTRPGTVRRRCRLSGAAAGSRTW